MSKKRGHDSHEEHMDESWLIPYADLLTLLLALFIVLFASSSVDKDKYSAMAQALHSVFGGAGVLPDNSGVIPELPPGLDIFPTPDGTDGNALENIELENLQKLQADLQRHFTSEGLDTSINMHIDERGLVISLHDSVLFDSGKADIRPEYISMLIKTGEIINNLDNYIRVEGHTDNVPINSFRFDSNWELSSIRATTVVRLFVSSSGIVPEKLLAVGYGQYRPVADNNTSEGRAKNRRVDIIILSSKFNKLEEEGGGSPAAMP